MNVKCVYCDTLTMEAEKWGLKLECFFSMNYLLLFVEFFFYFSDRTDVISPAL